LEGIAMRVTAILILLAGTAYGQEVVYNVSNIINSASVSISVTAPVQIAEGAITVDSSVNLTNIITIDNNFFYQTTITSTGETILVESDGTNYNLEVLSGGGGGSISNVFGVYPVIVTNFADNFYIGLVSFDGIIIAPTFTNQAVVQFGGPTNYTFSVPLTVTQMVAHLWGAAGFGSTSTGAGGYTEVIFPVTGGEALTVTVGEGSLQVPSTNAAGVSTARGGWPDGGVGVNRNNYTAVAGSGGGSSRLLRGTNIIAVAGAGGGAANVQLSNAGGGSSGGEASSSFLIVASGGTQTTGGLTQATTIALVVTNTAGSFGLGGDGGATTNLQTGAGGGGGGGWFGGGGGLSAAGAASRSSGGGGSGYWNPALCIYGTTVRGSGGTPALQESPYYGTDTGGFGWGVALATGTRAAHGGIVLRWETP